MNKKTITFELSTPVKYSKNGSEIDCTFIELTEPTGRESATCCSIESLIQSGIMSLADKFTDIDTDSVKTDDTQQDGESMIAVMAGAGVDMNKIVILYRELFKTVAMMGGEKPLTLPRMDDMSHSDFRKMIGEYTVNFIMN